jgi:hypothetical protein
LEIGSLNQEKRDKNEIMRTSEFVERGERQLPCRIAFLRIAFLLPSLLGKGFHSLTT